MFRTPPPPAAAPESAHYPVRSMNLDVTVISAKHLKNVNWRNGDLKPYAVLWLGDDDEPIATTLDDSGSTRPVWNERFILPINQLVEESVLTLSVYHYHSEEYGTNTPTTITTTLVGWLRFPLWDLVNSGHSGPVVRDLELRRPSCRPQGTVRLKLAVRGFSPISQVVYEQAVAPAVNNYYYLNDGTCSYEYGDDQVAHPRVHVEDYYNYPVGPSMQQLWHYSDDGGHGGAGSVMSRRSAQLGCDEETGLPPSASFNGYDANVFNFSLTCLLMGER